MYFGVQMYGVSKEWKQDPEGFLKKIYAAGYRQIEPCLGVRVDARDYGFWLPEDLEQAMPLLEKYHIEVRAVHIFWMNTTMKENLPSLQSWRRNIIFPGSS